MFLSLPPFPHTETYLLDTVLTYLLDRDKPRQSEFANIHYFYNLKKGSLHPSFNFQLVTEKPLPTYSFRPWNPGDRYLVVFSVREQNDENPLYFHTCFRFWNKEIDDGDGYLTPNELQILEAKANFVRNLTVY